MIRSTDHGQRLLFESDTEARFLEFHESNPHVYSALREMALALKRAGHDRWGIKNLYERLRYDMALKTTESQPSLNNNWTSYYARKLMAENPELANFFETRDR